MAQFGHHKYTWTRPHGAINHRWELTSVHGGVHFHCSVYNGEPACGLEFHSIYPRGAEAPDHVNCPLVGGRCWHDGTSLYASETLWPLIEHCLASGNHDAIFALLEREAHRLEERSPKYVPAEDE